MQKAGAFFLALWLAALGFCPASLAFEGAIYEIFPSSFADTNGDGVGDLLGVAQKADYIASLGVGAVWLTPIYPSPSYHGYDVTDYCAIGERMGTMEDFVAMRDALDARGVSILLDLVLNHTGSGHPWFVSACRALAAGKESPYTDYYTFTDAPGANLHAVPGAPGCYYLGEFGSHMPDLNLDSQAVRGEIEQILRFWLDAGVDGFRLDAVTHYYGGDTQRNTEFLCEFMEMARAVREDVYIVGEAWTDEATIARLWESGIDSLFDFPLADSSGAIMTAVREQNGARLARAMAARVVPGVNAPFLSNHDMGRSAGMLMQDAGKQRAAAAVYLLAPGHPVMYYGEEIGMTGSGRDENKRLPMVWGEEAYACLPPADADQAQKLTQGVLQQEAQADSLLNAYRQLLALRAEHPQIDTQPPEALDLGSKALYAIAYGDVSVVINMSKKQAECAWLQEAALEAVGGARLEDELLSLEPWSVAVVTAQGAQ